MNNTAPATQSGDGGTLRQKTTPKLHQKFLSRTPLNFLPLLLFLLLTPKTLAQNDFQWDQETILLEIFDKTNGLKWRSRNHWLSDSIPICSWEGVICDDSETTEQRIVGLDLRDHKLAGQWPAVAYRLPYLKSLDLRDNPDLDPTGFEGIEYAEKLEELALSNTGLTSMVGIGKLNSETLKQLHVTDNNLSGSIPEEVYSLTGLHRLFFNYNKFSGTLSTRIGQLNKLRELFIYDNNLTGQIPKEIGNLSLLNILALSLNSFEGTLPPELFNKKPDLQIIALQNQRSKGGRGISGSLPSITHLPSLSELYLSQNRLEGSIPSDFLPEGTGHAHELLTIELSRNHLTGIVPSELSRLEKVKLYLHSNRFHGIASELCSMDDWMGGSVANFGCEALACPIGYVQEMEGRQASEEEPCQSCPAGSEAPYIGGTQCRDLSPPDDMSQRDVLELFYEMTNGHFWKVRENWLSETVSECGWYGVSCDGDRVVELTLKENNLGGGIPTELWSLLDLQSVDLSGNDFESFSFEGIGYATSLRKLIVASAGVTSLEGVEDAPTLIELDLRGNNLSGSFPRSIWTSPSLEHLILSHNTFEGDLPAPTSELPLKSFHCYRCNLSSTLPASFASVTPKLLTLDLSENEFTGVIPSQWNNWVNIEYLALHHVSAEGLTGPLLKFDQALNLRELYLDGNRLTGQVPQGFLGGVQDVSERVVVGLSRNLLEGEVPQDLTRFDKLDIDLTENRITSLPSSLCSKPSWMDDWVSKFSCAAILCPSGTYNPFGRQTADSFSCKPCSSGGLAPYMGMTKCLFNGEDESDFTWDERSILEKFYYVTGGPSNWITKTNWLNDFVSVCEWHGVVCHHSSEDEGELNTVRAIILEDNGLVGPPPEELWHLEYLQQVNLRGNDLGGMSFKGIEKATNLRNLTLSETNLKSIEGVGAATSLHSLHLTDNRLKGSIPDEVYNLVHLQELYLNFNKLTGRISSRIKNLGELVELFLFHNELSGQIPAGIGELKNLKIFTVAKNRITGTLPEELNDLTSIEILSLEGLEDSQQGIHGPLLSLSSLPNLRQLFLNFNSLTGPIPSDFLSGIGNKFDEVKVDLVGNKLTGTLPQTLSDFQNMRLYVADNEIEAIHPDLCLKEDWMAGKVREYGCDAILCPPSMYNPYGRQSDDKSKCTDCPSGDVSPYYGSLECQSPSATKQDTERDILEMFFKSTGGDTWSLAANWMNDDVSLCQWYGVTCNVDGGVEALHLRRNGLSGTPPSSIFTLEHLRELNLAENPELVFSFDGLEEATILEYLNLDGTGLKSVDGLALAPPTLHSLHLADNELQGSIPAELLGLTDIHVLILAGNNLEGELPEELRDFSTLKYADLSDNYLSGELPEWVGDWTQLEYLRLAGNGLEGRLPARLGELTSLKSLDVSDQRGNGSKGLEGSLLDFADVTGLNELILKGNAFTGEIPSTLLSGVISSSEEDRVMVDLRFNMLTGHVPTHLRRFTTLDLYLAGNKITTLDESLCGMKGWLMGDVKSYGCDGLLCPPGTYNQEGRRSDVNGGEECHSCDESGSSYYGATTCGEVVDTGKNFGDGDMTEREALTFFYYACGGASWEDNTNWLTSPNICLWYGITCHESSDGDTAELGKIKKIDLSNNGIHGEAPLKTLFQYIPRLRALDLKNNPLRVHNFNGIHHAKELKSLKLSDTETSSLEGIEGAAALEELHLTGCEITGTLPPELYSLSNLKSLYLNYNAFTGTISESVSSWTKMEELYLFHNSLTGQLPSSFGLLSNLRLLALSANHFSGTLPPEMNNMSGLEVLSLQREGMVSGESESSAPMVDDVSAGITGPLLDFSQATNLRELYLGSNRLTGDIPETFLKNVADSQAESIVVDLTMNRLSGSVPSTLPSHFSRMKLYLTGNDISSLPDELCSAGNWMSGEVQKYGCDAVLCPPGTYNEYGRRSTEDVPCLACDEEGAALFYGSLQCEKKEFDFLEEKDILKMVYEATDGDNWFDNNNWNSDKDICYWHGITCGDNQKITKIDLSSNNLKGTPPSTLFQLPSLTILDLHSNPINLPLTEIGTSSQLSELDLSSTRVTVDSLRGLKGVAETLRSLALQGCDFGQAGIPEELFTLSRLKRLSLSGSNWGGTLPRAIGNMVRLQELYVTDNSLEGKIPDSLGNLEKLKVLALSENDWTGTLPIQLGRLPNLEKLYIDNFTRERGSGLTGPLLDFATSPFLNELYLGFNRLTGTIPSTLLKGVKDPMEITKIGLNSNLFTGTLPVELSRFKRLDIDVAGNRISALPSDLCSKGEWMGGTVATFECDAILCPPGTFNLHGRQGTESQSCRKCASFASPYFGSKECGSEEKAREKDILAKFFNVCGGDQWKRQDKWLEDDADYCEWYGISCDDDGRVESILLGSNNVVGTPPSELFHIANLKWLWLYSNPIDFRFDEIQHAKKLSSLLLDSTGLTSVEGIGAASHLVEIDLRFNGLDGPIPEEIFSLQRLESLSLSDNHFSGTLNDDFFAKLPRLKKLRLGSNRLTGPLIEFSTNPGLKSIDLSGNLLTGSIPSTFLSSLPSDTEDIFIDLSSNSLTGILPHGLARFTGKAVTIYVRDNKLEAIDPQLCTKSSWNDGDVGDFGCDAIACPAGTYALVGRQSQKRQECQSCPENEFMGSTACGKDGPPVLDGFGITSSGYSAMTGAMRKGACLSLLLLAHFLI